MTVNDRIIATIRTAVPALVGLLIARLVAQVPAVADVLAWVSEQIGTPAEGALTILATAGVIAGYYWVARKIGARWPAVEKYLLGSSLVPVYGGLSIAEQEARENAPKHLAE